MTSTDAPMKTPSAGAVRMRRQREREKMGYVYCAIYLHPEGINRMIEKGWLKAEDRQNRQAVSEVFLRAASANLWS